MPRLAALTQNSTHRFAVWSLPSSVSAPGNFTMEVNIHQVVWKTRQPPAAPKVLTRHSGSANLQGMKLEVDRKYPDTDYTVSHQQAAADLGVSESSLYGLVASGAVSRLQTTVPGRRGLVNMYCLAELRGVADARAVRPWRTDVTDADLDEACALYEAGMTLSYIKRYLQVSQSRARSLLVASGVEIRKAGRGGSIIHNEVVKPENGVGIYG